MVKELVGLGATKVEAGRRAVRCEADERMLYRINLRSRLALRVLVPVVECQAETDKDLYEAVYAFEWHEVLPVDKTIFIDHISFSQKFNNSQFLAYRTKDAIVDKIRDKVGSRPSVDFEHPDILLNVHASDESIVVSLDASGKSLNRRSYRLESNPDFTNEVLAAALVDLSGWTPDQVLVDPMCGSGTICIEAAMKARNIAANLYRKEPFGFQLWKNYNEELWQELVDEARSTMTRARLSIFGSDISTEALDVAKYSTLELGLRPDVFVSRRSLREVERRSESGVIITCPPTSIDGSRRSIEDFYKEIGYYLSQRFPDHDAWIYSTNLKALRGMGFHAAEKHEIYSGTKEGNFNMYPF